jgi:hypothetical protein
MMADATRRLRHRVLGQPSDVSSKQSIRRRLWNAPPSAGFWLGGVAIILGFGGA